MIAKENPTIVYRMCILWPYAWRVLNEIVPLVFGYIVTAEGRNTIFGGYGEKLNHYATLIWWIGVAVVLFLICVRCLIYHKQEKDRENLAKVQKELVDANKRLENVGNMVPSALKGILDSLKDELSLSQNGRVSLYLVEQDETGVRYFCQERRSKNLKYEQKCCRLRPLSKMFEKIWNEGELYVDGLPNPETKKGLRSYCTNCHQLFDVTTEFVKKIAFKGRAYVGMRIDDQDRHLAFLVVSSKEERVCEDMPKAEIQKAVKQAARKLGAVISALRDYIPSPKIIENQEGF